MLPGPDGVAVSPPDSYRLDPTRFAEFRRRIITQTGIALALIIVALFTLLWRFGQRSADIPGLVVGFVVAPWAFYRQVEAQRRNWNSFQLVFRDGKLVRIMDGYPPVELAPNEIKAIVESPRGIEVRPDNRLRLIFASSSLSNYDSFRQRLASWASHAPISEKIRSPRDYLRNGLEWLACAWVFGGPLYLLSTNHREAIFPLGIVLSLSMLAMILYVRNSPNLPISVRGKMWFLLLLPTMITLSRLL